MKRLYNNIKSWLNAEDSASDWMFIQGMVSISRWLLVIVAIFAITITLIKTL